MASKLSNYELFVTKINRVNIQNITVGIKDHIVNQYRNTLQIIYAYLTTDDLPDYKVFHPVEGLEIIVIKRNPTATMSEVFHQFGNEERYWNQLVFGS